MVAPNGPSFARSGSTWIHWWSPVASANAFTRSWSISSQVLGPRSVPASARSSSSPWATWVTVFSSGGFRGELLSQILLDDLAGGGVRQDVGEYDGLGDLVAGDPA